MKIFPLHATDFYKQNHRVMYPDGTQFVYSNFTARSDRLAAMLPDFDHKAVFFGLQGVIQWLLIDLWNTEFFNRPKAEVLAKFKRRMDGALGVGAIPVDHIEALHDLGYLPLQIRALREGSRVNIRVPFFTVVNTRPEFFWLTNYVETQLSAECWKSITNATIAYEYRRLLDKWAKATGSPAEFVPWQGHDFSARGMAGIHDAAQAGSAHLVPFKGTDSISSIDYLEDYYGATDEFIGGSVPATEHSVMCMGGADDEVETFRRLVQDLYPSGVVSIVSDTWDFWKVLTVYAKQLKPTIEARKPDLLGNAKVVFRPDCYDDQTMIMTTHGWVQFSALREDDLVAQVEEDGSVTYVKPTKSVAQDYSGDMIHFTDQKGKVDLLVTPNHRMVWEVTNKSGDGASRVQIKSAEESTVGYDYLHVFRAAKNPARGLTLSWLDRLRIAFQADGSFQSKHAKAIEPGAITGKVCYRFNFSKKRKTERLAWICDNGGFKFAIHNEASRVGQDTIYVWLDNATPLFKSLEWVPLQRDICSGWAAEFIDEASRWDGTRRTEKRFKIDTTTESVVHAIERVAIAAGYGCLVSCRSDDRQEHFNDVYTAHVMLDHRIGGQAISKKTVHYSGKVYCVTVPSGKLLVKRNAATAVSGNSGDPVKIICGDPEAPEGSPARRGAIGCLWDVFGGTTTSTGHRLLNPRVGLIYGDSITLDRAKRILETLDVLNFASANVVFGIGSYTYQMSTRDTLGHAYKCTWGRVNGEDRELFKDPVTDSGAKKSAKGLLRVEKVGDDFVLHDQQTMEQSLNGEMRVVFNDGHAFGRQSLTEIRARLLTSAI